MNEVEEAKKVLFFFRVLARRLVSCAQVDFNQPSSSSAILGTFAKPPDTKGREKSNGPSHCESSKKSRFSFFVCLFKFFFLLFFAKRPCFPKAVMKGQEFLREGHWRSAFISVINHAAKVSSPFAL